VLHLCSFRVRQPQDVDAAGLTWCRMTSPASLPGIQIDNSLDAAVGHDRHALVSLPQRALWDQRHHLALNVLLSMGPLHRASDSWWSPHHSGALGSVRCASRLVDPGDE
jgi:hypothetical protein